MKKKKLLETSSILAKFSECWNALCTLLKDKSKHKIYPLINPMIYKNDIPGKTHPLVQ